jgi:hypothetical protein
VREEPFFFENNSERIFGILHSPDDERTNFGFVFCCPFAYDGDFIRWIYAGFARRLASIGYYVLRFNYTGTGDSSGNFEDSTIETHISDILRAITVLQDKSKVQRVGLLGMGLGATMAAIAAVESYINVNPLILWEPIVDVKRFLDNSLRQSITFQNILFHEILFNRKQIVEKLISDGNVEHNGYQLNIIDGFIISRDFYLQSIDINLLTQIKCYSGNILVIQIDKSDSPFRSELINLVNCCMYNGKVVELLHANESVSWWTNEGKYRVPKPSQIFNLTENWIYKITK